VSIPARSSFRERIGQTLLRLSWLILPIGFLGTLLVELAEGHPLSDPHLYIELGLYGLTVPYVGWLLLTRLARNMARRASHATQLLRYQEFIRQLIQHQEWEELMRFLTQYPSTFLPVDHTALFIYDYHNARLKFAGEWRSAQEAAPLLGASLPYEPCQTCISANACGTRSANACALRLGSAEGNAGEEFCLPFVFSNLLVGALRLKCRPGEALSRDQIEFINATAPEVAVALALSISYPRHIAQVRTEAQMHERRYIASVLHNSLAQQIGYIHFNLDRLADDRALRAMPVVVNELENMRLVAAEAYQRIRNMVTLLYSSQHSDLTQAIVSHARTVAQNANFQFDCTTRGDPQPLAPPACEHINSLLQEGLNNVAKHASARHVHITLGWSPDTLEATIADDGIGFDPSVPPPSGHYGITIMQERVKAMKGSLVVDSAPGHGTRLVFAFPLDGLRVKPRQTNGSAHQTALD
jgi:signal transduction histidine kinase